MFKKVLILVILALILAIVIVSVYYTNSEKNIENVTPSQSSTSISFENSNIKDTPIEYSIILKEDTLIVTQKGSDDIEMIVNILPQMLPQADIERLKKGISVEGYDRMLRTIEDYTS